MNKRQTESMNHPNVLGAGAEKRRKLPLKERGEVIAAEFERGTLYSGSGKIVKSPAQMRAIAYSKSHPKGEDHPHNVKAAHRKEKH